MSVESKQVSIFDLLGEMKEKPKEETKEKILEKEQVQPTSTKQASKNEEQWNGGTKDLWVSTFYKMLRIGNPEAAFVAYNIIKDKFGINDWYVITKLEGLVGEDCCPNEMPRLLPMLRVLEEKRKDKSLWGHHMAIAIYEVATAKKWYQTEDGRRLERMRHLYWSDSGTKEEAMRAMQVPTIAFDTHTKYGRGPDADKRLDGHWWNRFNVEDRWKRLVEHMGLEEPLAKEEYDAVRDKWVEWHLTPLDELKRKTAENKEAELSLD